MSKGRITKLEMMAGTVAEGQRDRSDREWMHLVKALRDECRHRYKALKAKLDYPGMSQPEIKHAQREAYQSFMAKLQETKEQSIEQSIETPTSPEIEELRRRLLDELSK